MSYIENPKTVGSGIICAIPQTGHCPNNCEDCFFQSGRSYLEPLEDNLPNMPTLEQSKGKVVRVNDGNDSNVDRELVVTSTAGYPMKFYNTSIPRDLEGFDAPVVLTVNPGRMTDDWFYALSPVPHNIMFLRFRVNAWNTSLLEKAILYYSFWHVPVVMTFMDYFVTPLLEGFEDCYSWQKHVLNSYWMLKPEVRVSLVNRYEQAGAVYACGKGESSFCRDCGNCLREYFATTERLKRKRLRNP